MGCLIYICIYLSIYLYTMYVYNQRRMHRPRSSGGPDEVLNLGRDSLDFRSGGTNLKAESACWAKCAKFG